MKKFFLFSALVIAAAGCSFFPSAGEPARKYTLSYTQFTPDVNNLKVRLLVDAPTVYSPLDTLRICLKNSERSIDYFADVEWANRLNSLIHESIIYSFENTGKFPSVSRPADGAKVDKVLKVEVRGFYMDFFSEPPQKVARVDYSAQIIDKSSRRVTATKAFRAQAYVSEERIEAYIQALNQAHINATTQMIKWTVDTLKKAKSNYTTDEEDDDDSSKKKGSSKKRKKSSDNDEDNSSSAESNKDDSAKSGDEGGGSSNSKGSDSGSSDSSGAASKIAELKDKASALKGAAGGAGGDAGGGDSNSKEDSGGKKDGGSKSDSDSDDSSKKDSGKKKENKKGGSKKSGKKSSS